MPALLAATQRIQGVKSGLLRFLGVSLVATLMTRWWLFRACNNPVPADNGSGDTQPQQVVGCCNHCCGNARDKGPSNKCCTPTIPVSSQSNNNNKTTNNSTLLLHQNTSQQCESVRIMFNSVFNKIIIKVLHIIIITIKECAHQLL